MAEKTATNKSQAIRDYYEAHPEAKPKEVVAALKKAKIEVSSAFVSQIRTKLGGASSNGNASRGKIAALEAALAVERMGGVQKVKDALAKADSDPIVKLLREAKTLEKALEQVEKSQAILAKLEG